MISLDVQLPRIFDEESYISSDNNIISDIYYMDDKIFTVRIEQTLIDDNIISLLSTNKLR